MTHINNKQMNLSQTKLFEIASKTNGRCFYCNAPGEEVDHFISKSKFYECGLNNLFGDERSPNEIENLFISCKPCNRRKSDQWAEDFMGGQWIAWTRYDRANRRIGIEYREDHYLYF